MTREYYSILSLKPLDYIKGRAKIDVNEVHHSIGYIRNSSVYLISIHILKISLSDDKERERKGEQTTTPSLIYDDDG